MIKSLKNKKKKGFTLIELIIVIAIIAILAAIAIPQFGNIRKKANVNADLANAKTIASVISVAIADEDSSVNVNDNTKKIINDSTTFGGRLKSVSSPKTYKGTDFYYQVDTSGDVIIYVGKSNDTEVQVYPKADSKYGESSLFAKS